MLPARTPCSPRGPLAFALAALAAGLIGGCSAQPRPFRAGIAPNYSFERAASLPADAGAPLPLQASARQQLAAVAGSSAGDAATRPSRLTASTTLALATQPRQREGR